MFAFVDEWLSGLARRIFEQVQSIEDTKEKIRRMLWIQLDFYEQNPRVGIILYTTIPYKTWATDKCFKQEELIDFILEVTREGQDLAVKPDHRVGDFRELADILRREYDVCIEPF